MDRVFLSLEVFFLKVPGQEVLRLISWVQVCHICKHKLKHSPLSIPFMIFP